MGSMSRRLSPGNSGVTEYQKEVARYLAAVMYQKLLVEQQQKTLQDEINRQYRLRWVHLFFFFLHAALRTDCDGTDSDRTDCDRTDSDRTEQIRSE